MNNAESVYSTFIKSIGQLKPFLDNRILYLKAFEGFFPDSYKAKYIDLLFELTHNTNQLIVENYYETLAEYTNADKEFISRKLNNFVFSYVRLLNFFSFAKVDYPDELDEIFDHWKDLRSELLQYL